MLILGGIVGGVIAIVGFAMSTNLSAATWLFIAIWMNNLSRPR